MFFFSYFEVFFFTATILKWQPLLNDDRMKEVICQSMDYMSKERCKIYGFVIMPNHIHLLLAFENGQTISNFQRDFLKFTAQKFIRIMKEERNPIIENFKSSQGDRKYHIWERRAYWAEINAQSVFDTKLNYIHNNPLSGKWNLCDVPEQYEWSSSKFYEGIPQRFKFLKNFNE